MYQVLLVENEERTREQASSYPLWKHGFYRLAGVAVNGKDALEKMAVNRYDIVIADVTMPVMGGLELCRQIRDGGYSSCVILAGPQNDFYCAREGMRLGAVDYIEKPYSEEKLTEALFFAGRSRLVPEEDKGIRFYRKLLENPEQADVGVLVRELCAEAKKGCLNPETELRGRVLDILEQIWQKMEEEALWLRFLDPVDIPDGSGRFCGKLSKKLSEKWSGKEEDFGELEIQKMESEGAKIRQFAEQVITENIPHGKICIGFTPDEEVGRGADFFDVEDFGADFAYTVDGGAENEIEYENFNAAGAKVKIKGFSVHPGSSKNTMINAALVAMEFNNMLPAGDTPANTEEYEGFFHLCEMSGDVSSASLDYIIRDHDSAMFACRQELMRHIVKLLN